MECAACRCVDDMTLLARTREHFEKLAELMSIHRKEIGKKIDAFKTRVITAFGEREVKTDNKPVEKRSDFISWDR